MKLPGWAPTAVDRRLADALGPSIYAIGGSVRDKLINHYHGTSLVNKDQDYVVVGIDVGTVIERLERIGRVNMVGDSFGVLKVNVDGETVDIAFARREVSTGIGHKDFDVSFGPEVTLQEDMTRRDISINTFSVSLQNGELYSLDGALSDLQNKKIRVLNEKSFLDDPLRMLRCVQFAARFDFEIESDTLRLMTKHANLVSSMAQERVAEEFVKLMVKADKPSIGLDIMLETGLIQILPEIANCVGVEQNVFHKWQVYRHITEAADAADKNLVDRVAAVFHDVGKPITQGAPGPNGHTFYNHEVVGAEMTRAALQRLRFSNDVVEQVTSLVRNHMYRSDMELAKPSVLRFVRRVGPENIERLFKLREADVTGCGRNVEQGIENNRKFAAYVRQIINERPPLSVKDLDISGSDVILMLLEKGAVSPGFRGGKIVGDSLKHILELVTDQGKIDQHLALNNYVSSILQEQVKPHRHSRTPKQEMSR